MAITFDSVIGSLQNASGTSHSYSFTNTAGNFVVVVISPDNDTVSGVTYGGQAMTSAGASVFANSRYQKMFYLENAPTGANNVVISYGSSADSYSRAISFSGVATSSAVSGYNTATGSSTTPTIAVTTSADNSFVIAGGQTDATATAGANTTQPSSGANPQLAGFWYSTNAVTPAGSFTVNINATGGGAYGLVGFAFAPPGATFQPRPVAVGQPMLY